MKAIITLPQETDTPAQRFIACGVALTTLYDRSRDSRDANTSGQDFIAYTYDAERITFAICDGVSQSFFGDLAARFLGERLASWLAALNSTPEDSEAFAAQVDERLHEWAAEATVLVQNRPIRDDLPPIVREALDRKRISGSESMFIAGQINLKTQQLAICWLGDMRFWLFDDQGESNEIPDAVFETRERWSTRGGPRNHSTRVLIRPLAGITRITLHSDGFGSRAPDLANYTLESLNTLAGHLSNLPASDDLSMLDIHLAPPEMWLRDYPPAPEPLYTPERIAIENTSEKKDGEPVGVFASARPNPRTGQTLEIPDLQIAAALPELPAALEPVELARTFSVRIVLLLGLLLALALSVGWYMLYMH